MNTILLGNNNPQIQKKNYILKDGEVIGEENISVPAPHLGQSVTRVEFAENVLDTEFVEHALSTNNDRLLTMIAAGLGPDLRPHAIAVQQVEQILAVHSGGDAPAWVAFAPESADDGDPAVLQAIAKHFGCAIGEPTNLLTNAGRDALHAQHMSTSAQPASFNYGALSASTAAASSSSTTLPGEITTGGGGLIRAQMTYAHTGGTNTTTLTHTWAANGSDALPVTIAKLGVLNAGAVGTLGYETLLNATTTLTISGDSLTVTETVTGG